jgi:hypothetical protein
MMSETQQDPFRKSDPFGEYEPLYRSLRVYALDPSYGRRGGNHLTLRVPYERLAPGPIGSRVQVIDQDANGKQLNTPVDLNNPDIVGRGGLEPNDTDPHFRQQMVYAVISHLLRTFDRALGREMRFRARETGERKALRVVPHGENEANAYYDSRTVSLTFGNFSTAQSNSGRTIPGQSIYTCLSHAIVVHETTHALLDSLRPRVFPNTLDASGFHEGFADLVALLGQFTFQPLLLEMIQRTGGRLYAGSLQPELEGIADDAAEAESNPLMSFGQQFAQAIGLGTSIRSAVSAAPRKDAFENATTPHERGTVLTSAVLETFFQVHARRTRGLFRLSRRDAAAGGDLHPDLAKRLAADASQLASSLLQLCIRAVAYCPAVEFHLGDYLRAILTVHARLDPDDRDGFRDALIDAFARRGIYPPDVGSMSEAELIWKPPAELLGLPRDVVRALRTADAAGARDHVADRELRRFCDANRAALGFAAKVPLEISPFHQAIRFVGPELDVAEELVCQVFQDGDDGARGTTLIFGDDRRMGRLRYAIGKRLPPKPRISPEVSRPETAARRRPASAAGKRKTVKARRSRAARR